MSWKNIGAAGLMAVVSVLGSTCFAQDLRTQQTAIEKDIATLNQQISSKQQQVNALRNRPSPEQAELAAAQKTLNDARTELKAKPGSESEGKVRNAEFKLKLAQIKYDKAHGDVEALNDEIDKLKQQIAGKQQQIKDLGKQATEQQADAQQQKVADDRAKRQQQEQELARSKQEAESARKEIERLKAALAVKETAEAKALLASPAAAAAPVAVAAPAAAKAEIAPAKPAATAPAASATADLIKLDSQQAVLHALQETAQRTAGADTRHTINQSLYVKSPNVAATNKDKITLKGLGNNQYRGNGRIAAGQYEASLGFNRWPVTFSASEAGELVFLLDYSDEKNPRLTIYNSALEGGN